jgi:uncharacterized surface protein with fasciclin (FAS1) repeats
MPFTMKKLIFLFVSGMLLGACSSNNTDPASNTDITTPGLTPGQDAVQDDESQPNILQIAAGSPDHQILATAVAKAELTHVLANNGPLTVFAPTDEAFGKLPAGTVETLIKPENKATLQQIITYHAAPGTFDVDGLKDGMSLYVATGDNLKVEVREDGTYVGGGKILGTVKASNGIVHVVDKVLLKE